MLLFFCWCNECSAIYARRKLFRALVLLNARIGGVALVAKLHLASAGVLREVCCTNTLGAATGTVKQTFALRYVVHCTAMPARMRPGAIFLPFKHGFAPGVRA